MMRWIVNTSLRLRFLMLVGAAMLIVFGTAQFRGMPIDVYPEFAPPKVEVQILCLGMPAADVEALVTVPMEQALSGIEGLDVLRKIAKEPVVIDDEGISRPEKAIVITKVTILTQEVEPDKK